MATPGRPRQSTSSGIARVSSIPTPGRSRSTSHAEPDNSDDISRAFVDAVKANDPNQHRNALALSSSTSSLSPQTVAYSGRRSVVGRPSSAASSSSRVQERAKTPISSRISSRPPSRQSELSKPNRTAFSVGDHVRIESLGFEGVLRYVGDIDGKSGLWAGVELSGGFFGKGKNDGSVGGKHYFTCPDKCGVFVATTKLSAPTVGPGAVPRPSSVASHKGGNSLISTNGGRMTPSLSNGSRTPSASYSNGRVTPSSGRITPSFSSGRITPSSSFTGIIQPRSAKTPSKKFNGPSLSQKITEGSRASKYMTMTAAQLSRRDTTDLSSEKSRTANGDEANTNISSPALSQSLSSSPIRSSGSPFSTPKPSNVRSYNTGGSSPTFPSSLRSRPSANTPRPRIPSGMAMPPPPSPRSDITSATNIPPLTESELRTKGFQENDSIIPLSFSRPTSSASIRSGGTDEVSILGLLQSRLEAAEYENERLRLAMEAEKDTSSYTQQIDLLQAEREELLRKYSDLELKVSSLQVELESRSVEVATVQTEQQKLLLQLNDLTSQLERNMADRQSDSDLHSRDVKNLGDQLEELNRALQEKEQTNLAQKTEIEELLLKLDNAQSLFQGERDELLGQIDELRIAGQETIALYEERLSIATSQRYDLENVITGLEAKLETLSANQSSPESQVTLSATQIDNETLRDQVQHLQRKSAKLEEQLEEARATLERDVASYQDKITRSRVEEEHRKRELVSKTRELEQLVRSEAAVKTRVEEIEEALRESTIAHENTRGELETLRTELANLDVMIDDASGDDICTKLSNFTKKATTDKLLYQDKIKKLEQMLAESDKARDCSYGDGTNHSQEDIQSLSKQDGEGAGKYSSKDASESSRISAKIEASAAETAGLKHIIQELQKESMLSTQQIKRLETEKQLLVSEAAQLRQEINILESNLKESLRQNKGFENLASTAETNVMETITEEKPKLEMELEQMRKRLNEAEVKHARTINGLNKEISELEALVEAKIYREDELEQELEKLKDKLSRQKKAAKTQGMESAQRLSTASTDSKYSDEATVCEICERPGHDIFNCSLLKDDKVSSSGEGLFCEDCEETGHVAADCPHSADVF